MTYLLLGLAAWIAVGVAIALVLGRAIRVADSHDELDRRSRESLVGRSSRHG